MFFCFFLCGFCDFFVIFCDFCDFLAFFLIFFILMNGFSLVVVVQFSIHVLICECEPIVLEPPWELIVGSKVNLPIKDCPDLCTPIKIEVR